MACVCRCVLLARGIWSIKCAKLAVGYLNAVGMKHSDHVTPISSSCLFSRLNVSKLQPVV